MSRRSRAHPSLRLSARALIPLCNALIDALGCEDKDDEAGMCPYVVACSHPDGGVLVTAMSGRSIVCVLDAEGSSGADPGVPVAVEIPDPAQQLHLILPRDGRVDAAGRPLAIPRMPFRALVQVGTGERRTLALEGDDPERDGYLRIPGQACAISEPAALWEYEESGIPHPSRWSPVADAKPVPWLSLRGAAAVFSGAAWPDAATERLVATATCAGTLLSSPEAPHVVVLVACDEAEPGAAATAAPEWLARFRSAYRADGGPSTATH